MKKANDKFRPNPSFLSFAWEFEAIKSKRYAQIQQTSIYCFDGREILRVEIPELIKQIRKGPSQITAYQTYKANCPCKKLLLPLCCRNEK
jgi:hypothetical protein